MSLHLTPLAAAGEDRDELVSFLTRNVFPFHVRRQPTGEQVSAAIDAGEWGDDATETFWIEDGERGRVGIVRLDDLADATAMVDLRLDERHRGLGLGAAALTATTDRLFREHPGVIRLEGQRARTISPCAGPSSAADGSSRRTTATVGRSQTASPWHPSPTACSAATGRAGRRRP